MTEEKAFPKICKDCGSTLRIYEIDLIKGRQVKKCPKCGLYYFYKKNRWGKWQFAKAVKPDEEILEKKTIPLGRNVFVVHGGDTKSLRELKSMLKDFDLNPIILYEKPSGSMTIIEKLEKYSKDVSFAFVLLTPDEALIPTTRGLKVNSKQGKKTPVYFSHRNPIFRARQNVILEFGFFIEKLGRNRVCCLYRENTELPYDIPSDMHGIVYIRFKESVNECRDKMIEELEAVGYKLKV